VKEPYKFKHGSRERGHCWDTIADNLNSMGGEKFIVDQRSVRDRFSKLEKNHKRKMAEEKNASGISPEFFRTLRGIGSHGRKNTGSARRACSKK
jgi:hypothetical protein